MCFAVLFYPSVRGFVAQVYNSFGLGYRLTNQSEYADRVLTGADTLYGFRWQVRRD